MKKFVLLLAAMAALFAVSAPAASAKPVKYVGKTSSGHKITFTVKKGRIYNLTAGIAAQCLSIQGGGAPISGAEIYSFRGYVPLKAHNRFKYMQKPAFWWKEVTMTHDLWVKKNGRNISGRLRQQYSFLMPKYPIGTFQIYSCLGGAKFKAKPKR